jgi:hypothetical protein
LALLALAGCSAPTTGGADNIRVDTGGAEFSSAQLMVCGQARPMARRSGGFGTYYLAERDCEVEVRLRRGSAAPVTCWVGRASPGSTLDERMVVRSGECGPANTR